MLLCTHVQLILLIEAIRTMKMHDCEISNDSASRTFMTDPWIPPDMTVANIKDFSC